MAAYVKGTVLTSNTGNNVSGSVSSTAGNALFCGAGCDNATNPTITGGGVATWTKDASGTYNSGNSSASLSSGPNTSGGTNTLTATAAGSSGVTAIVMEFSGEPTSGTIADNTSPAINSGLGTGTATTNSLTNVSADTVFIAFTSNTTGANPATFTSTGTGWTGPADAKQTNAASFVGAAMGYKIENSVGAETESWTIDSSNWGALIAVYDQAGSGMSVAAPLSRTGHRPKPFAPGIAR